MMKEMNEEILASIALPKRSMAPFITIGGKGNLLNKLLKYIPRNGVHTYCEPFCRAASVFWSLPKRYDTEILNDLDETVINLYRVLQDHVKFEEFMHRVLWTPYALSEFNRARETLQDPDADDISRAWALFTAANQGFGGVYRSSGTWGRSFTIHCGMPSTCNGWVKRKKMLPHYHKRLQNVKILCQDAFDLIPKVDSPSTLFYCDPPYVHSTRKSGEYEVEMTDEQHERLVEILLQCNGMVVLSGYYNEIYAPLENSGWGVVKFDTASYVAGSTRLNKMKGDGSRIAKVKRTEVLWINPACLDALNNTKQLFQ